MELGVRHLHFAPKDVAHIVGLTPPMQRDWRRNGYLPERSTGWSNFSLVDIAGIALRKCIVDVPLRQAIADQILEHPVADDVLHSIAWWALDANEPFWSTGGDSAEQVKLEIGRRVNSERAKLIDWLADIRRPQLGRLVILTPGSGEVLLTSQGYQPGEAPPGPISFTIYLDEIGRQISDAAGRALVEIVAVGSGAIDDHA